MGPMAIDKFVFVNLKSGSIDLLAASLPSTYKEIEYTEYTPTK